MRKTILALAVAAATLTATAVVAEPALATPTGNSEIKTGSAGYLRAEAWQHNGGGGYRIRIWGSNECDDNSTDFRWSKLSDVYGNNWNDAISFVWDHTGCDVVLYKDMNFAGAKKTYNTGTGSRTGVYVGDDFNDQASSIVVT